MKSKTAVINWTVIVAGGIFFFLFFYLCLPSHLLHREQIQAFIYSDLLLDQYAECPAFISCLAGDFLLQFFCFSWCASLIISLLLLCLGIVLYKLLNPLIHGWSYLLIIPFILWEAGKLSGLAYPLSATISLIGGGLSALLFRRIRIKQWRYFFAIAVLFILAAYWMFGVGMWLTLPFLIVSLPVTIFLFLIIEAIALPVIFKNLGTLTWNEAYAWPENVLYDIPDFKREQALKADNQYYYHGMTSSLASEGNHLIDYYNNLSDARYGQLPDNLLSRISSGKDGLFLPVNPGSGYHTIYVSNEVWFELGDMTMAEHATLLGMIFSPRNTGVRALKRLAEINLINGDEAAAMKYLRMLQQTLFYKDWANNHMPGQQSDEVKKWLADKQKFIPATDTLRTVTNIPLSLHTLLQSNPNNRMALEYLLCYYLLHKDVDAFANTYETYSRGYSMPRIYQEAYLIALAKQDNPVYNSEKIIIPEGTFADFLNYNNDYKQFNGDINLLKDRYINNYWFYYHFAQHLE